MEQNMEQNAEKMDMETEPTEQAEQTFQVDPAKMQAFNDRLEAEQNLLPGVLGGVVAAVIGAAIWAVVTVATKYQIGWMAIGVGFLVGFAVRTLGKGVSKSFGIVGAMCALFGCLLGNVLTACGFLANQESIPVFQVVLKALTRPALAVELIKITFSPMDLLFYGIAVYEGYKFSFRQITPEEIASLSKDQ